jgi:hypothetical protein
VRSESEQTLLNEIAKLADRVRAMRAPGSRSEPHEIRALEDQSRSKWQQLRVLRAGPVNNEPPLPRERSSRR